MFSPDKLAAWIAAIKLPSRYEPAPVPAETRNAWEALASDDPDRRRAAADALDRTSKQDRKLRDRLRSGSAAERLRAAEKLYETTTARWQYCEHWEYDIAEFVPWLAINLLEPEEEVRRAALRTITAAHESEGFIGPAIPALVNILTRPEPDPIAAEVVALLTELVTQGAAHGRHIKRLVDLTPWAKRLSTVPAARDIISHHEDNQATVVRREEARALIAAHLDDIAQHLLELGENGLDALYAVMRTGPIASTVTDQLIAHLDGDIDARTRAVLFRFLAQTPAAAAIVDRARAAMESPDSHVRGEAVSVLAEAPELLAAADVLRWLRAETHDPQRHTLASLLARTDVSTIIEPLVDQIASEPWHVQVRLIPGLGRLTGDVAYLAVVEHLTAHANEVRWVALGALIAMREAGRTLDNDALVALADSLNQEKKLRGQASGLLLDLVATPAQAGAVVAAISWAGTKEAKAVVARCEELIRPEAK